MYEAFGRMGIREGKGSISERTCPNAISFPHEYHIG
jgi:hypothetical protein